MLTEVLREELRPGDSVLDLCTGSGAVATRLPWRVPGG